MNSDLNYTMIREEKFKDKVDFDSVLQKRIFGNLTQTKPFSSNTVEKIRASCKNCKNTVYCCGDDLICHSCSRISLEK